MSYASTVSPRGLATLARAVEEQVPAYAPLTRLAALGLCREAVEFAREGEPALVGTRARSAAHLLLELTGVRGHALRVLSLACEAVAVTDT